MKSIGQTNAPNLFEANWNVAMQQCLCQPNNNYYHQV